MKKTYSVYLYDDIGNAYERKNKYLLDLHTLHEQLADADKVKAAEIRREIAELKKNRNDHPYIVKLREFKETEKQFLQELKAKTADFRKTLDANESRKLRAFREDLYISIEKAEFYKEHTDICYEADMAFKEFSMRTQQLPEIIEHYIHTKAELASAKKKIGNIDKEKQRQAELEFKRLKKEEKIKLAEGKAKLKQKRKDGMISDRALHKGIIELRKRMNETIKLNSYSIEEKNMKEVIVGKRYILKKGTAQKVWVLNSNISDARRNTPVEIEKRQAINAWIGLLVPGLAQLLNKQYIKAALFTVCTLFIYSMAVPYALGYGNYQGTGISGLISLAEGARRIDRSLIFMIEGVIAIFLMIISFGIGMISFLDAYRTEKGMIKGTRQKNWFETTATIEQEGFPLLVSTPALLIIMFIVLIPIATTILLSFTGMDPNNQAKFPWVGIANYRMLFLGQGLAGSVFWLVLGWTIIWTLVASTLPIIVGFFLAVFVNHERVKFKGLFRTIYILPWAVPAFITIMFFAIMLSPTGALTQILSNLFNARVWVRTDVLLSRITLILLQTWLGSSYVFLLFTGVLQAIPNDLYEAAQIDGATALQKLRRITVPIVLFQTAPLLVGQYTFNFNNFSIIWLFNEGGPYNPSVYGHLAGGTDILASYIFKLVMQNQYQSIGAAISIIVAVGLMFFAFLGFRNSKAFKEERL
ncbi:carbohydrate ABC transporter permease [Spirochaeta dissipatitropha]